VHEPSVEEPTPPEAPPALRIELKPQQRVRPQVVVGLLLIGVLLLSSVIPPLVEQRVWDGLVLAVFAILVVPIGLVLLVSRAPGRPVIELGADRMRLPVTPRAHEFVTLRYRDVTEMFVRYGPAGFVWIGTPRGAFVYALRAFSDLEHVGVLIGRIEGALEGLPDWDKRKKAFDEQQQTADDLYGRRIWGTQVTLGLGLLGFLVQALLQAPNHYFEVVELGANVPILVREGQLYRLFTSNLLHVDAYHLVMNGVLVLWLGGLLERLFGTRVFALVALLAAVLGPAASVLSGRASVVVGISSVAFGLLGAFAYTTYRMKGRLPLGVAPPMRMWLTLGILLAFLGMMSFGADFPSHLGGFLAGVLVVAPLLDGAPRLPLVGAARGPLATGLIGLLAAWGLISVIWAAQAYLHSDGADQTRALAHYVEHQEAGPVRLNVIAWFIAIDPDATPERLEQARIAAHRAVSLVEEPTVRHGVEDTLATIYYRLGRFDEAIDREAKLAGDEPRPVYATQLARFARARAKAEGPRVDVGDAPTFEVRHHDARGFGIDLASPLSVEPARTLWWTVQREGKLEGLLRLPVDEGLAAEGTLWLRKVGIEPVWHEGSTFTLVWVQAGRHDARGWLMDEEILAYP